MSLSRTISLPHGTPSLALVDYCADRLRADDRGVFLCSRPFGAAGGAAALGARMAAERRGFGGDADILARAAAVAGRVHCAPFQLSLLQDDVRAVARPRHVSVQAMDASRGRRRGVCVRRGVRAEHGGQDRRRAVGCDRYGAAHRRGSSSSADRKSTRLNSSHTVISYAVFCLKKKKKKTK